MKPIPIKYTYSMISDGTLVKVSQSLELLSQIIDTLRDKILNGISTVDQLNSDLNGFQMDSKSNVVQQILYDLRTGDDNGVNDALHLINGLREMDDILDELTYSVRNLESMSNYLNDTMQKHPVVTAYKVKLDKYDNISEEVTLDIPHEQEPSVPEPTPSQDQQFNNLCVCAYSDRNKITNLSDTDTLNTTIIPDPHPIMLLYLMVYSQYHVPKSQIRIGTWLSQLAAYGACNFWALDKMGQHNGKYLPDNIQDISFPDSQNKTLFYVYAGSSAFQDSLYDKFNQFKKVVVLWGSTTELSVQMDRFTVPVLIINSTKPSIVSIVNKQRVFGSKLGRPLIHAFLDVMNVEDNKNFATTTYADMITKISGKIDNKIFKISEHHTSSFNLNDYVFAN